MFVHTNLSFKGQIKKLFPRAGKDTEHKQNNAKHRLDVQKYEIKKTN